MREKRTTSRAFDAAEGVEDWRALFPGADQAEARVVATLDAAGRLANGSNSHLRWTPASPGNHGVDIAAWPDLEDNQED